MLTQRLPFSALGRALGRTGLTYVAPAALERDGCEGIVFHVSIANETSHSVQTNILKRESLI